MQIQTQTKENAPNTNPCRGTGLVETVGLEPMTPCMSSKCSNQLSYASIYDIGPNAHCECFFIIANFSISVNPFPLFFRQKTFHTRSLDNSTKKWYHQFVSAWHEEYHIPGRRQSMEYWFSAPYDCTFISHVIIHAGNDEVCGCRMKRQPIFCMHIVWNE